MRAIQLVVACGAVLSAFAGQVQAGMMLTIQPNAVGDTIFFSATISSPYQNENIFGTSLVTDDDGIFLSGGAGQAIFYGNLQVGNFKTSNSNEIILRDGFAGFQVLSGPTLFDGFYLDDDGSGVDDDFAVIFNGPLSTGEVLASIPMHPNGFDWNWNVGTYTNNSNVTIIVTNTPYNSSVVPEPSSLAFVGIGALGMVGLGCRRKQK